ncbi:hypothetical protein NTE_03339 [Candidatus Nitrososphaera evergladensis SR1]|jgi:hypothetical protein|uniref:Uncharacterized protein n=1 Tax=Candidatus Nitrososphaera evergladensis SR1 TaxID=1459636 RepID=A0A075MW44_9ARCH|nr:hypothetical protein [Candidatus Nitrososphaera evergladensis]AIF85368.1 hypothetical protein NTE_03339 [Candidatus Nitrososphaera evergladensis SR1]
MSSDNDSSGNAEPKKESVFGIMDDLLSHLNRTKKFFMALVISSFVVAPLAIVLSILMLTPQFLTGVGQQQDVVFSQKASFSKAVPTTGMQAGQPAMITVKIVPGDEMKTFNITGLQQVDKGSFIVDKSQIHVDYVPANVAGFAVSPEGEVKPLPPRFMYVSSAPAASPFDVTWMIVAVIAVSATMAGAWLLIGIKEYRFFSHWNSRYANYKAMQEKVDKELDGSTGQ